MILKLLITLRSQQYHTDRGVTIIDDDVVAEALENSVSTADRTRNFYSDTNRYSSIYLKTQIMLCSTAMSLAESDRALMQVTASTPAIIGEGYEKEDGSPTTILEELVNDEGFAVKMLSYTGAVPFLAYWSLSSVNRRLRNAIARLKPVLFRECKTTITEFYSNEKRIDIEKLGRLYGLGRVRRIEIVGGSMFYLLGEGCLIGKFEPTLTVVDICVEVSDKDGNDLSLAGLHFLHRDVESLLQRDIFLSESGIWEDFGRPPTENDSSHIENADTDRKIFTYYVLVEGVKQGVRVIYWHSGSWPNYIPRLHYFDDHYFDNRSILERTSLLIDACGYRIGSLHDDGSITPSDCLMCLHPLEVLSPKFSLSESYMSTIRYIESFNERPRARTDEYRFYFFTLLDAAATEMRWVEFYMSYYLKGYDRVEAAQISTRHHTAAMLYKRLDDHRLFDVLSIYEYCRRTIIMNRLNTSSLCLRFAGPSF